MLPAGSLTRDNLRIGITLADQNDLITQVATAVWEVSELEYVCEYVMIAPEVARAIESMNPMGIRIPLVYKATPCRVV